MPLVLPGEAPEPTQAAQPQQAPPPLVLPQQKQKLVLPGEEPTPDVKPTIKGYVSKYDRMIEETAKQVGVKPDYLRAIHYNEDNADDPNATSSAGAEGLMQMEPSTFAQYADKGASITDPQANLTASARYYKDLLNRYDGNAYKAFAAYNLGHYDPKETDSIHYAKQAEANLKYLEGDVRAKSPADVFKRRVKPAPKTLALPGEKPDNLQRVRDAAGAIGKGEEAIAEKAGGIANATRNYIGAAAWNKLTPDEQQKLVSLRDSQLAKGAGGAVNYVGQIIAAFPSLLDASMRDTENKEGATEFRNDLVKAISDPKHSEEFLSRLNAEYTPFGGQDQTFWKFQPGLTDVLGRLTKEVPSPATPVEIAAGLYADTSRFLMDKPALRDIAAFAVGWFNPANRVPGVILSPAARTTRSVVNKFVEDHAPAVKAAYTKTVTTIPFGDRFYSTQTGATAHAMQYGKSRAEAEAIGKQAAAEHYVQVLHQSAAPHAVATNLLQPNKLGGLDKQTLTDLWKYHEKFNNKFRSSHILQPGSDTHARVDPVTQALTMTQGPLTDVDYATHLDHKFVYHPTLARKVMHSMNDIFASPKDATTYKTAVKAKDWSAALQTHPNITQVEVDEFMKAAAPKVAGLGPKLADTYMKNAVEMRIIGEEARRLGVPIQLASFRKGEPETIVFGQDMKAVERDHGVPAKAAGTTTMDERAFYTASYVAQMDAKLTSMLPITSSFIQPGSWSRARTATSPGAFQEELSLEDWLKTGTTAEKFKQAAAGGGVTGQGPQRNFHSLQEAYDAGMKDNPDFDPSLPLISQMTRSARLANYASALFPHTQEIHFARLTKGILNWSTDEEGKLTRTSGKEGFEEMHSLVHSEAIKAAEAKYTEGEWSAMGREAHEEAIRHESAALLDKIQTRFEKQMPGMVWNAHNVTALEEFKGLTLPSHIANAAHDSHPSFHSGGRDRMTLLGGAERPETNFANGVEMLTNLMRTAFLSTLPYHPVRNIAWLGFRYGNLNPKDLAQALFAPHTIDDSLFDEIKEMGLSSTRTGQMLWPLAQSRYRVAADPAFAEPGRNQYANVAKTSKRIKAMLDSFKRTYDPKDSRLQTGMHYLGNAYYHGSKWAQDTVFGLGEDAFTALTYKKFKDKGFSKEQSARKTRELFGDHANMTEQERQRGLGRIIWFFNWFKTQMRLGASNTFTQQGLAGVGATRDALNSQNTNDPNNQDPTAATKYGSMSAGEEEYNVAPPTIAYDDFLRNLPSAVTNRGQAIQDFDDFVLRHIKNTLTPDLKPLIQEVDKTMALGPNQPQIPKEQTELFGEATQAVLGTFTPALGAAIAETAKDPARYLTMMGIPVTSYKGGVVGFNSRMIVETWKKGYFDQRYMRAKRSNNEQEMQNVLQQFHARVKPFEDRLKAAQGK